MIEDHVTGYQKVNSYIKILLLNLWIWHGSITEKVLIFLNQDIIDLVDAYLGNRDMKYILSFFKSGYQVFKVWFIILGIWLFVVSLRYFPIFTCIRGIFFDNHKHLQSGPLSPISIYLYSSFQTWL